MKKIFYLMSCFIFLLSVSQLFAQSQTTSSKNLGKIDEAVKQQLNEVLLAYYHLKNALVASHATDAQEMTSYILSALNNVDVEKMTKEQNDFFKKYTNLLKVDLNSLAKTLEVDAQRAYFHGISTNLKLILTAFQANKQKVYEQHCPMAFDNRGASWLSAEKEIKNPYYGSRMMKCGTVIEEF
jgi:membrane fusion protein, copper/silver efflux system